MSDDDDDWETVLNNFNSDKNYISQPQYIDIQAQVKLLESREMEEKADNELMNELFSDDSFKIQKDNINNKCSKDNIKKNTNKVINKYTLQNDNYKIKNYHKNKQLNDNKNKELIKVKNNKKILNNKKNEIFGNYEDNDLDMYCNIEDKYLK
jgi:carboxypeptidase C (cathepsin A)